MEIQIGGTSAGIKIPLPKDNGIGFTFANGVMIQFRQGLLTRQFVMSKPISFDKDGTFGAALLCTKWVKVKDPKKEF